jgi:hypothetical protein
MVAAEVAKLSAWECWHFDHHGYLLLEDVVPPGDIAQMVEVGSEWHGLSQEQLPPPLHRTGSPTILPPPPNYINHLQYCDDAFHRLALNPEILRVVRALTGGSCTLVDTALTQMRREGGVLNEGGFHGELGVHVPGKHGAAPGHGSTRPGEQYNDYHVTADGQPYAGFLNCGVSLVVRRLSVMPGNALQT